MPTKLVPDRTATANREQLEAYEETDRQRISLWWEKAGLTEKLPCSTTTAVKLLNAVEYRITSDDVLTLLQNEAFPEPKRCGTRLVFMAHDIVNLGRAAEARRMWQPHSLMHQFKMTLAEKLGQNCEHAGAEMFSDLDKYDWPALLGLLIESSGQQGLVQFLAEAIRAKLKKQGAL